LIRIEPKDYQLALDRVEAQVKEAHKQLLIAQEESQAAIREWRIAHPKSKDNPPPLVAKIPQLTAARASLKAAQADREEARLHLERTVLKAPFPAVVVEESIDEGQYVSTGQKVATIFSTKAVEIAVPLEDKSLAWLNIPGLTVTNDQPGSLVAVKARFAGQDTKWSGQIVRAEGRIDHQTRLVKVVVRIEDPYAKRPPLAVGLFAAVEFIGRNVEKACFILESALHNGKRVWVVDNDNRLRFRQVEVLYRDGDRVLIGAGLYSGEQYVVSQLKTVSDGMQVRIQQE
jgi:RND family efflux transporter MFP subunit